MKWGKYIYHIEIRLISHGTDGNLNGNKDGNIFKSNSIIQCNNDKQAIAITMIFNKKEIMLLFNCPLYACDAVKLQTKTFKLVSNLFIICYKILLEKRTYYCSLKSELSH